MTTSPQSSDEQIILLRQKVFELTHQLELIRIHNQNLISQVAQLKEKQAKQKQINDMLVNNLKNSQQQITDQITLNINGQFLTQRVRQLQEQLQKYKSGVSQSVDRRVKKIVNEYTQEKDLQYEKKKSRLSMGPRVGDQSRKYFETHEHKYYNIEYKTYGEKQSRQQYGSTLEKKGSGYGSILEHEEERFCENCLRLQKLLNEKDGVIEKLSDEIRTLQERLIQGEPDERTQGRMNSNTEEWKLKYLQTLKLYENLKQKFQQLQDQLHYERQSQSQQKYQEKQEESYRITHSPIKAFHKKLLQHGHTLPNANQCQSRVYNEPKDRQEVMLQEITNLVNGLGKTKKTYSKENYQTNPHQNQQKQHIYIQDKKSRLSYTNGASRISQAPKLDTSQFTIKQGVNRYGQQNQLF